MLYDTEVGEMITDRNETLPVKDTDLDTDLDNENLLVLKKRYSKGHARYVHGVHFTKEYLSCPTKTRLKEKVTGRNIYDLAMTVIRNVKNTGAVAEKWLDDGKTLPSGKSWDDLYDHVISKSSKIFNEKSN